MNSLQVKLCRLAAMTPIELLSRGRQALTDFREYLKYYGRPDYYIKASFSEKTPIRRARLFHIDVIDDRLAADFYQRNPEAFDQLLRCAEDAVHHRFAVLDRRLIGDYAVPWHYDPLAEKSLLLVFGRRMDYFSPRLVKEVRYVWELNRCRHFVTLAEAWRGTRREEYAEALFTQWRDWLDKNPYPLGINWASALECALRLIAWTWALILAHDAPQLDDLLLRRILRAVERHLLFIDHRLSIGSSANNHLVGEAVGLIYAGFYAPVFQEAEQLCRRGFQLFQRAFPQQVFEDGVAKEQSVAYQAYLIEYGLAALSAARLFGETMPEEVTILLHRMADFLRTVADKSYIPKIGDEDGGAALPFFEPPVSPLRVLATMEDTQKPREQRKDRAAFWLFPQPMGQNNGKALSTVAGRLFPHGGYAVLSSRVGRHTVKIILDGGPLGLGRLAAHGHADFLAVWMSIDGKPVLIDAGTYLYLGAGKERDWFRSARAHSTLIVDEREPARPLGPFQWGKRPKAALQKMPEPEIGFRAEHDGYSPIKLSREVKTADGGVIIIDRLQGVGNHRADAYFHLAPCRIGYAEDALVCSFGELSLRFSFEASTALAIKVDEAPHSPHFGGREMHPVIRLSAAATLPMELKTRIRIDL
ncbi:MAG: heparinase II/III family protein [candidate division KSB1 bacterium]|nr:heparinase II/III family protein [candidate division KSB1 bacterium]